MAAKKQAAKPEAQDRPESPDPAAPAPAPAADKVSDKGAVSDQGEAPGKGEAPEQAGLQKAQDEAARFKDLALRAEAELQNVKKRALQDMEKAHKFALERLMQNLLPFVDSLEKAMEAGADGAHAEGLGLCHKLLLDILGKEGMEAMEPLGHPFDPDEHQAISLVDKPDMEPNSVCEVVQKGYKLHGRVLRAAMVMVARPPEDSQT